MRVIPQTEAESWRLFWFIASVVIVALLFWKVPASAQPGTPVWTNRYDGSMHNHDYARAMAVDGSGNVIVTGYSYSGGANDYATIKYSNAGKPLWTNHYNGPGSSGDEAYAVAVDDDGNVYVTGLSKSTGSNGSEDYATIAYSSAGAALWTNRYNGPGNSYDLARAVSVDRNGIVYVTGSSLGDSSYDYATVAYSSTGLPLWTNRYDGPGNYYDEARALAVDGSNNVYVTGYSSSTATSGSEDYVTIAYSSTGVPLWTNRYNGPANNTDDAQAVAADGIGNVYVTGKSYGGATRDDYATIKYSSEGTPLWTNRYDGVASLNDSGQALAVDGGGNVIVTGYSQGSNSSDYTTIMYSDAGLPLWTNLYNGVGNGADEAQSVAVDGIGSVYVTGYSYGGGAQDYATVAYSNTGRPLWTNRYNGPANSSDYARALAVDGIGNVYVTGYSSGGGYYDYATIKYSGVLTPSPLSIQRTGNQIVLSWSNAAFGLQSATAVQVTYTNVPAATSPYTNTFPDTQRFFRLKAN